MRVFRGCFRESSQGIRGRIGIDCDYGRATDNCEHLHRCSLAVPGRLYRTAHDSKHKLDPRSLFQMESLEKRLKASNEAKSRLAKDKKSLAAKTARAEGEEQCSGAAPVLETERL